MSGIKPPKPLVVNSDADMSQQWTEWLELYENYFTANKLSAEEPQIRTANFKACVGVEVLRIINNMNLTAEEKADVKTIKIKLTDHFAPSKNKTYERCQFHRIKQHSNENFEAFLHKLQTQVKKCSYGANADEFVMDQIVVGIYSDATRQKLWTEDEMTLVKTQRICRAAERASKQINELQSTGMDQNVNALQKENTFNCRRCGRIHGSKQCPAYAQKCNKCDSIGHWAIMCRAKKTKPSSERKNNKYKKYSKQVNALEHNEESSNSDEYKINAIVRSAKVNQIATADKWSEVLKIGNKTIKIKLDTGAECNVLPKREALRLKLAVENSNTKRIITYNNDSIQVVGEAKVNCETKNISKVVTFKIVDEDLTPILGRASCESLGLIARINEAKIEDGKIGCCKNFTYEIDFIDDPTFKIIPPRRIAHALRDKVKTELNKMVQMKVIRPVSHPTPAVSPIVIVTKKDKIRLCMDPTDLNKNIKRRHYPLQTVEEIAASVHNAKIFTKLDCQKGFWQIPVTKRTSEYLTFSTPWGRYQFLRLPFGISSAPEIFSEIMNTTLEGIPGCKVAMDDIFLYAETVDGLRAITTRVVDRLKTAGFTLNKRKCEYEKKKVKFLGHLFSAKGIEADTEKVEAIKNLREPTNVKELQRILGMVTYLAKFIPNLSNITEPLRILLQKETEWYWDSEQKIAFENVKKALSSTPVLKFYDVNKPVRLSVDASSKALGACLLQNDQPVAYATRALTPTQQNYPQIEKEAMAIKFGCKKFHEYVYGKRVEVETDHKPLETIFKKPLQNAPLRLQRILWDVIQYSPIVTYKKGTQIPIADTLSRDCNPVDAGDDGEYSVNIILSFTDEARERFVKSTSEDLELQMLKQVVLRGWPDDDKMLPQAAKKYANFKEEITFEHGLLFKGHKVIVPKCEINKIVRDLHSGHAGVNSSIARARQSLYWFGLINHICDYIQRCSVCQQTQRSNVREPQLERDVPEYPFQIVSTDIFNFKGDEYVLIADHYSGFMDFKKLKLSNSQEVIDHMRQWFSVHGIPETLESDGGPQYTSKRFADFASTWQFNHQISSPYYPKSNGFAERNVQTAKNLLKRCYIDKSDSYLALLMLRNTPRNDVLKSTCQRLYSRATRTIIPTAKDELKPKVVVGVQNELKKIRNQQRYYADRGAKTAEALKPGDKVRMQTGHREWIGAQVVKETQFPRSVIVETNEGKRYRRNTHHLHKTKADIQSPTILWPLELESQHQAKQVHETPPESIATKTEISNQPPVRPQPSSPTPTAKSHNPPRNSTSNINQKQQPAYPMTTTTRSGRVIRPLKRLDL